MSQLSQSTTPTTLRLSAAQRNAWVLQQFQPSSPAFNVPLAFRIEGDLDPALVERCLNRICQRHDVLRTTYPIVDGEPVAHLLPDPCTFTYIDLRDHAAAEATMPALLTTTAQRPFQLAEEVPLRVTIWRTGERVYWLLIVSHHIQMDGFSSRLLLEELSLLYQDLQRDDLPELPMTYAEFATWQHSWQQTPEYVQQLDFWKRQLADFPKTLDLPTDFVPPAQPTDRGATHRYALTTIETASLRAYCAKQRTTPYICYLSALFVVLYRYTQQPDLIVGMPVSVRNQIEIENLIGYFANQLPIRCQLSNGDTFSEVLRQVTRQVFSALDQQDIPFENLVSALVPERSLNYTPLFRVIMVLQKGLLEQVLRLPNCAVRRVPIDLETTKMDIYWTITDSADQLTHSIEFSTDLFTMETIARLAEHVQTLLTNAISSSEQNIAQLPIMTAAEYQRTVTTWNATERDYARDQNVPALFEQQVARTPDAVALYFDDEALTYAQLNLRVNQLAHHLLVTGIQPETLIGVCLEPAFEMLIAILAILKAGGAYVPLDPDYPAERRDLMIRTAGIRYVVTLSAFADTLSNATLRLILLDTETEQIALHPTTNPANTLTPDRLAYVLFTSGSTGIPKGVMGTQRGIIARLAWMWMEYPFAGHERGVVKTSINFVDSLWELFGSLLCGLPSVLIAQHDRRNPLRLIEMLAQHRVTRMILVPTLLEAILAVQSDLHHMLPALCFWMSSGEALQPDLVARFAEAAPHAALYNIYGASEMCDISCYRCVPAEPNHNRSSVPIGKPIHNVKAFVLDAALQPVPIGVVGELFASGDNLARGYLNDQALTDRKFLTLPLPYPQRVYRTGDLAKYLPDGTLLCLGRADTQVKIRGFRVELGEIETILRSQLCVATCVVVKSHHAGAADHLIGYVVFKAGYDESELPALWVLLRQKLPDYMLPARLIVLDELPTTPNGKIDRRALPLPSAQLASEPTAQPTDALETQLLDIWQGLLHVEGIGIHDRFFDCGGNSLLAIQLITRINQRFDCKLAVNVLFHTATIAQFAVHIREQRQESEFSSLVTIRRVDQASTLPPVFCFHALFGNILFYDNLLHHLPADAPIYGFQAQGVDGKQPPLNNIERLAECYTAELLRVQPTGPYCLIGYSMGGKIAMEVGRRLLVRGHHVPMLMIIDDILERNGRHRTQDGQWRLTQGGWLGRFGHRLASIHYGLRHLSPEHRAAYLSERWHALRGKALPSADETRPSSDKLPPAIAAVCESMYYAVDTYIPAPYTGHITYIRAQDDIISIPRFQELTRLAAGGFTIHDLPGQHLSIVRPPFSDGLARKIADCYQTLANINR